MMIVAGTGGSAMRDGRWTLPTTGVGGSLAYRYVPLRGSADREKAAQPRAGGGSLPSGELHWTPPQFAQGAQMKWMVTCCMALVAGCSSPATRTTPTYLPTPTEAQKQLEAAALGQAQEKCGQSGKVAVATRTANATTYECVSPEDPRYKSQQAAKPPQNPPQ